MPALTSRPWSDDLWPEALRALADVARSRTTALTTRYVRRSLAETAGALGLHAEEMEHALATGRSVMGFVVRAEVKTGALLALLVASGLTAQEAVEQVGAVHPQLAESDWAASVLRTGGRTGR